MINKYKYPTIVILSSILVMIPVMTMADKYFTRLNQRLAETYDQAVKLLVEEQKTQTLLINTQEQWKQLIKVQCEVESAQKTTPYQGCMNRETQKRIQVLQILSDYHQAIEEKRQLQKNIDKYEYQEELFTELDAYDFKFERFQNIIDDSAYIFLTVLTKNNEPIQTIAYKPPFVTMQPSGASKQSSDTEEFLDYHKLTLIDLNYDGYDDIVLFNGRSGSYGLTHYNIYLYNPEMQQFIENKALNKIFTGVNQKIDPINKTIISLSKQGSSIHTEDSYRIEGTTLLFHSSTYENGDTLLVTQPCGVGKWCMKAQKTRE